MVLRMVSRCELENQLVGQTVFAFKEHKERSYIFLGRTSRHRNVGNNVPVMLRCSLLMGRKRKRFQALAEWRTP